MIDWNRKEIEAIIGCCFSIPDQEYPFQLHEAASIRTRSLAPGQAYEDSSFARHMKLPDDFIAYLRSDEPKFGDRDDFPVGFELWDESDLESFNIEYEVPKYAAGFFGFGSDGGGEMLAFGPDGKVYALPFIGMEPKVATFLADSWSSFRSTFKSQ